MNTKTQTHRGPADTSHHQIAKTKTKQSWKAAEDLPVAARKL